MLDQLTDVQLHKLWHVIRTSIGANQFYRSKLMKAGVRSEGDIRSAHDYVGLPFTTKKELVDDQAEIPPFGSNLAFPLKKYVRIHQTSGTTGEPLRLLDTRESWAWWVQCWSDVFAAAGTTAADRIFFAFSFGPFIGFWSGFAGAEHIGALAVPGGGMSSIQRLRAIIRNEATVLVSTPTYALHLAEVAEREGIDIVGSSVSRMIHAGETGAGLASVKKRLEDSWGARCYDHAGATEVGAWGFECGHSSGMHLNEDEFIFEVIDPGTLTPATAGELVVTNLGRIGMPVIRYRTGDYVVLREGSCACGRHFRRLDGGVIGRVDGVLVVRGINVFPSAIENVIRQSPEVVEFSVDVIARNALDELDIRLEIVPGADAHSISDNVRERIREFIGLRADVRPVPHDSLPRCEIKSRRFRDRRPGHRTNICLSEVPSMPPLP